MQSAKETASNIAASAKAGMDKTRAVAEEKAEKLSARDPVRKEMAEQKKDAKINEAERMKHETRGENVAARRGHGQGYTNTGTGATGYSTGTTDLPAGYSTATGTGATGYTTGTTDLPAGYTAVGTFGEDYPAGVGATTGSVGSEYPAGRARTGTGRTGVQDPRVTGRRNTTDYGPGGTY